jgi:two-component system OmpR family response regulator
VTSCWCNWPAGEAEAFDRSIDLRVSRLRRRLRDDAREPVIVKTVRHEGYVLSQPVRWSADPQQA